MPKKKGDVEVTSLRKLPDPNKVTMTKAQFFNVLDACWEAWGESAILADLEVSAWGKDIGQPEWLDEWMNAKLQ